MELSKELSNQGQELRPGNNLEKFQKMSSVKL